MGLSRVDAAAPPAAASSVFGGGSMAPPAGTALQLAGLQTASAASAPTAAGATVAPVTLVSAPGPDGRSVYQFQLRTAAAAGTASVGGAAGSLPVTPSAQCVQVPSRLMAWWTAAVPAAAAPSGTPPSTSSSAPLQGGSLTRATTARLPPLHPPVPAAATSMPINLPPQRGAGFSAEMTSVYSTGGSMAPPAGTTLQPAGGCTSSAPAPAAGAAVSWDTMVWAPGPDGRAVYQPLWQLMGPSGPSIAVPPAVISLVSSAQNLAQGQAVRPSAAAAAAGAPPSTSLASLLPAGMLTQAGLRGASPSAMTTTFAYSSGGSVAPTAGTTLQQAGGRASAPPSPPPAAAVAAAVARAAASATSPLSPGGAAPAFDHNGRLNLPDPPVFDNTGQFGKRGIGSSAPRASAGEGKLRGVGPLPGGGWSVHFRSRYLGSFNTAMEAARAYDHAAIAWDGDDAITNFPLDSYKKAGKFVAPPSTHQPLAVTTRREAHLQEQEWEVDEAALYATGQLSSQDGDLLDRQEEFDYWATGLPEYRTRERATTKKRKAEGPPPRPDFRCIGWNSGMWCPYIKFDFNFNADNKYHLYLGSYEAQSEAKDQYDTVLSMIYGPFADSRINNPPYTNHVDSQLNPLYPIDLPPVAAVAVPAAAAAAAAARLAGADFAEQREAVAAAVRTVATERARARTSTPEPALSSPPPQGAAAPLHSNRPRRKAAMHAATLTARLQEDEEGWTARLQEDEEGGDETPFSNYRGVYWGTRARKWVVFVVIKGKHHNIGYFTLDREEEAAAWHDAATIMVLGTGAIGLLNKPYGGYVDEAGNLKHPITLPPGAAAVVAAAAAERAAATAAAEEA